MIVSPARGLAALEQPGGQLLLAHLKGDHTIYLGIMLYQQLVQGLSLWHGAGKAVKDEALGLTICLQVPVYHTDDHFIRHQLTGIDIFLCQGAKLSAFLDLCAEQVAGGQVGKAIFFYQLLALGAFACPRRAKKYDIEH